MIKCSQKVWKNIEPKKAVAHLSAHLSDRHLLPSAGSHLSSSLPHQFSFHAMSSSFPGFSLDLCYYEVKIWSKDFEHLPLCKLFFVFPFVPEWVGQLKENPSAFERLWTSSEELNPLGVERSSPFKKFRMFN